MERKNQNPSINRQSLRTALKLLVNLERLGSHPLASLGIVKAKASEKGNDTSLFGMGKSLRDILIDSIERLKPDSALPGRIEKPWRLYWILNRYYVKQTSRYHVAAELGISITTYDHALVEALERLANIIREQEQTYLYSLSQLSDHETVTSRKSNGIVPSLEQANSHNLSSVEPELKREFDVFISHASEDKDIVVRPLAMALRAGGLKVWYDEFELKIGDSLRRKIDAGLAQSRFGVVVLSHSFFAKGWTKYELDGLVTRAVPGEQIILPIWHKITQKELIVYSPSLADIFARSTGTHTVEEIAKEIIIEVIRRA